MKMYSTTRSIGFLSEQETVRQYHNDRNDTGAKRFSSIAGTCNQKNKEKGVLLQKITTKALREEFHKRHPDMIFRDEDGAIHLMTLEPGPNQISVERINDSLPDGSFAPVTLENIRFIPFKLNGPVKASPDEIKQHKQDMSNFTCPRQVSEEVLLVLTKLLSPVKAKVKSSSYQARGIILDPQFTVEVAACKLIHVQEMRCAITRLPMLLTDNSPFTISLARIRDNEGYTWDNVMFICRFRNIQTGHVHRRSYETPEETNERAKKPRLM